MNDQQAAEYVAGIESEIQAARWSLPVSVAVEAWRNSQRGTNGPGLGPRAVFDLEISGDHRPRLGRRRDDDDDVRSPWAGRRDTDEHVIPCLLCGAEIRLAREVPDFDERRAAAIAEHVGLHAKRAR